MYTPPGMPLLLAAREKQGMPKFDHAMDVAGSQAIRAYVIDKAQNTIALCESDGVQYLILNSAQMSVATKVCRTVAYGLINLRVYELCARFWVRVNAPTSGFRQGVENTNRLWPPTL